MTWKRVCPAGWRTTFLFATVLLAPLPCPAQREPGGEPSTEIAVASDFAVGGQCVVWRTTKPIPDATIYLMSQRGLVGEPEWVATTETDDEGRFKFTGLEPPSDLRLAMVQYTLVCDAKDHAVQIQRIFPHIDSTDMRIGLHPQQGSLQGHVVDADGKPVAGAKVSTWTGARIGVGMTTTAADGSFELMRLPVAKADSPLKSLMFRVTCQGYPSLYARAEVPAVTKFTMPRGCGLHGLVRDEETGRGVAGIVITAIPMKSAIQEERTVTNERGRFELSVAEGNYHILLEDDELVAPAIANIECRAGTKRELPPMIASPGGWLTGRIVHPSTGDPVVFHESKQRVVVSVYGPATPKRDLIGGWQMAVVDDDGRFRIRVAPGENYPYTVNTQSERMSWDTDRQPPIAVPDRGVARCFIKIKVRRTDEEKMVDARKVIEDLPKAKADRTAVIIDEFRKLNHTVDQCELWCLLMKDLVEIGSDAVPALCRELDETSQQRMMRRLGFALRAIDDPRAVPALIRAIPKTLQPSMSDYGLIVADVDLLKFMQEHDLDADRQDRHFSFGRPVREIFAALNQITGQELSESELYHVHRAKDQRTLYRQQQQYQATAQQWRDWWQTHFREFGVEEAEAVVNLKPLPALDLSSLPTGLRLTKHAQIDRSSSNWTLSAIGDQNSTRCFLDLDTGRVIDWPKSLSRSQSPAAINGAIDWAAKQGADLICVPYDDGSDKSPFVLRSVGMQLWEIDSLDARNIGKRLEQGRLPAGRKIDDGLLMHLDPKAKTRSPKVGSSFLYLSREDGLGIITITDFVTQVRDITGMFQAPKGVGYQKGVRFDWKTIAR